MLILSATDENDSTVFKREYVGNLNNREIYADKIYSDIPFYKETQECKKTLAIYSCKSYQRRIPEVTKRRKLQETCFQLQSLKSDSPLKHYSTG